MVARAARRGDLCTGHDDCKPRPVMRGSPDVFVDDKPAVRKGDPLTSHGCAAHAPHKSEVKVGSSAVTVNDRPFARVGDDVACGGALGLGSPDVEVG
jgi:uncharacterized Zn-binding protein involved in type VI secretion